MLLRAILVVLLLFIGNVLELNAGQQQSFSLSSPVLKKLIIGDKTITFTEEKYLPPAELRLPMERKDLPANSLENVLIAHLSSIMKHDIEWNVSLMDNKNRQKALTDSIKLTEKMKETFRQADALLASHRTILDKKIMVANSYAVISFDIRDKEGELVLSWLAFFVLENGEWHSCGTCGSDPNLPLIELVTDRNFDFDGMEKRVPKN